jgi:hypothetical protein
VFIISLFFICNANSQRDSLNYIGQYQLIFKEGRKFIYEFESYKFEDLKSILETYPESLHYYNETFVKKKTAKRTTILLLASCSSTTLFYWLANRFDRGSGSFYQLAITSGLTLGTSLVLIPINILQYRNTNRHKIKSTHAFNERKILENGFKQDLSYLHLGITGNGLGLVFNF